MRSILTDVFGRFKRQLRDVRKNARRRGPRARQLMCELLEDRRLLAAILAQDFDTAGSSYSLIEPVTTGINGVTSGGPRGNYFRLNGTTSNSSKNGQPDLLLFDDTLSLAGQALHAQFDYRETIHTAGGAEGVRFTLYPADSISSASDAFLTHSPPYPIDIGRGFPGVLHLHFDTFNNAQGSSDPNVAAREPNANHLEVNYNSNASASGWLVSETVPFDINDAAWHTIDISLIPNGQDGLLTVTGTSGGTMHTIIDSLSVPGFAFNDYRAALWADYGAAISLHDIDNILIERPGNEVPTLDAISDLTIDEDASEQTVNLTGISAGGGESQPLRVTTTSSKTSLIPHPAVTYSYTTFGNASTYTAGNTTHGVAVGDFDGDGHQDVAAVNQFSGTATVIFGDGTGSFSAPVSVGVGNQPYFVVADDFDGDGIDDIVASNFENNTVTIRLGTADRNFGGASSFATGNGSAWPASTGVWDMETADLNGDGNRDLVTSNIRHDFVSVMLGNGAGGFGSPIKVDVGPAGPTSPPHQVGPYGLAITDFNGDGNEDVAVVVMGADAVRILLGDGTGALSVAQSYTVGDLPHGLTSGDFNNDGNSDLVAINEGDDSFSLLTGNGNGTFSVGASHTIDAELYEVTSADFDLDGNLDLLVSTTAGQVFRVLGNGDGTFATEEAFNLGSTSQYNYVVVAEDLNHDGLPDVASALYRNGATGAIGILLSERVTTGSLKFTPVA
ncbi:MAG: VCBS repeat-containing protein, partial [Fuerstiella sp.]